MSKRVPSEEYEDFDLPEPEIRLEGDSSEDGFRFEEPIGGDPAGAAMRSSSDPLVDFTDSDGADWSDDRVKELEEWEGRLGPQERRITWFLTCVMMASVMGLASAIAGPLYLPSLPVNGFMIVLYFAVGAVAGLVMVIPALKRWVG